MKNMLKSTVTSTGDSLSGDKGQETGDSIGSGSDRGIEGADPRPGRAYSDYRNDLATDFRG